MSSADLPTLALWPAAPEWISAIATMIAALVAVVTVFFLRRQILDFAKQNRLQADSAALTAKAARSSLYETVSAGMQELNHTFAERPELRKYFYEGADYSALEEGDLDLVRIDNICETILDFADDVVEQYRALPDGMDWTTWWTYFRWLYANSPKLRSYLWENHTSFYPDYVLQVFGFIIARSEASGRIQSFWIAHEEEAEEPGYPWVRKWRIQRGTDEGPKDEFVLAEVSCSEQVPPAPSGQVVATITEAVDGGLSETELAVIRSWVLSTMAWTTVRQANFSGCDGYPPASFDLVALGLAGKGAEFAFPIQRFRATSGLPPD